MVMKRLTAPMFWPIERKTKKYVADPRPGPHRKGASLPLVVVLRDVLKHAFNAREARSILNSGQVLVDGRPRKDTGFPVGLMDVITVGDENYRVLTDRHGLHLVPIDKKESGIKLLRLAGKGCVKKGKLQAHFHDGTNLLVDTKAYRTGDVIVFDIPGKKVKDLIKLEKNARVLVVGGNNMGVLGTVENIIVTKGSKRNEVIVDIGKRKIALPHDYVFAIGKHEPIIKIGEGS